MKKTVLVFGLIAGAIVSAMLVISLPLIDNWSDSPWSMIVGFASMLLAFCLMVPAVKTERERQGGAISFGKAFGIGSGIALIAAVCYTITWIVIYKNFYPEFMDQMISNELAALTKGGKSAAQIAEARAGLEATRAAYNTWPGLIGYTMLEIFPLGVVVALIVALMLKRKPRAVAGAAAGVPQASLK